MYDHQTSSRLSLVLFFSQSFFTAAQIAIFTLLSIVAVQLSGTESAAGLPSSAVTFAQAFAAYPIGLLMGRYGRRIGLSVEYSASIFGGVFGVLALVYSQFSFLLLSAMLLGIGRAGADQSRFAAGELFPAEQRARVIGRIVFAGTIGAVAGPALVTPSIALATALGLPSDSGPWLMGGFFYAFAFVITFSLLRPDPMSIARQIGGEEKLKNDTFPQSGRPLRELLMLPTVQLAIVAMLISQTVMVVLMVMTPLHMSHHNHPTTDISLVLSAHTLGMFGLASLTGYLIDRIGRINTLFLGAFTLILAALIAPTSTSTFTLVVALFLLGLGWNFGYVAGSTLLSDALQGPERARVQGINDTLVAFAAGLGNLSAGPLFQYSDYSGLSMMGLALTLILVGFIVRWGRPKLKAKAI